MDIIRGFWTFAVFIALLAAGMQLSGCYASRFRSETPAGTEIVHETTGPFYGRRDVVIDSRGDYERCLRTRRQQGQWFWSDDQATCYQQTTSASRGPGYGYGGYGPAPDYFGYVRTQYAGTEFDPAMAGAIRPPPPVPRPPSAAGTAPAPQGGTDPATLRTEMDATQEAVVDLNERVLRVEDMHCRRHPRRCRRGGGQ